MSTQLTNPVAQPYLNFDGRCEEAIEFYKNAIGAEVVMLMRFKDSPEPPQPGCMPPGAENKVIHAHFRVGESNIMASDCHCGNKPEFKGFSVSLTVTTGADADRAFNALAAGGQIQMPLAKTFFSDKFGVVVDRFGLSWMILVTPNTGPTTKQK